MASIRRVSSLTSGLLKKARLTPTKPAQRACTSLLVADSQIQFETHMKEDDGFWKEESNAPAIYSETVNCIESKSVKELEKSRIITADGTSSKACDKNNDSAQSISTPKHISVRVDKRLPWHSVLSLLRPNLNIQPVRFGCTSGNCDKDDNCVLSNADNDDCKPKITSLDMPLTCVTIRKPPAPCVIPKQRRWASCDKGMCLPCCCPIERPLRCKIFDIKLNTCPRKTYRIAAYSECSKRYGRKQYKKECCYAKRICYAGKIADRELKPLIHIKDRQALTLGFSVKAMCNTPLC